MTSPPTYVTVTTIDMWGVGKLMRPDDGRWWVDVVRIGLSYEDAADLRDVWNARGTHKR
jgi:hypothetical protein